MHNITFDKEKVSMSLAKLKTHGHDFEVVIDPDNAIKLRHGEANIRDALKAPNVFRDAMKGELASEQLMQEIFNTNDQSAVAEKIIKDGELHFTDEYKDNVRNDKKKVIIAILLRDAADANTGNALTEGKITGAMSKAKINIDIYKKPEDQLPDIIAKLRTALPITLEKKILAIRIPALNAAKLYGTVTSRTRIVSENWLGDGSWSCRAELPAGKVSELMDELKSKTHGDVEINVETATAKKR
ncbi:MAG: ribosome assembly factor SBDS [archaeon]